MFLPSVMQYFNDLTPGRRADLRPGHRPARPAQEVARGTAAEEPQPGRARASRLPIVTSGVTHALSLVGDLFVDKGDMVLLPDKFWENYELLFGVRFQAQLALYPFFNAGGGFNVEALRQALATRAGSWKTILILNFPNNPTGYSITKAEADADHGRAARGGRRRPQPGRGDRRRLLRPVLRRGRAARSRCSPGWPAATSGSWPSRSTGPTKEEFVWGFRTGMLTFSTRAFLSDEALYEALEKKVAGAIRSAISNCSHVAPVGAGQGHGRATRSPPSGARRRRSSRPGPRRSTRSSAARVRRTVGAVSVQRRLLHVPEAQGPRRRDLPQAPAGEVRRGRDRRRRTRHPHRVLRRSRRARSQDLFDLMAAAARDLLELPKV